MMTISVTQLQTTASLLATKFNNEPFIPLLAIASPYLGLSDGVAKRKARDNTLPFPVIRLNPDSQKSPWMVSFSDLLEYVERISFSSRVDWLRMQ